MNQEMTRLQQDRRRARTRRRLERELDHRQPHDRSADMARATEHERAEKAKRETAAEEFRRMGPRGRI